MDRDGIRARFRERLHVTKGLLDHEVAVQEPIRVPPDGRHECGPEGEVVHEVPVHDVQVEERRLRYPVDVPGQVGEIGAQDRGRHDGARPHGTSLATSDPPP